jgi:hypothetical protein
VALGAGVVRLAYAAHFFPIVGLLFWCGLEDAGGGAVFLWRRATVWRLRFVLFLLFELLEDVPHWGAETVHCECPGLAVPGAPYLALHCFVLLRLEKGDFRP